MFVSVNDWSLKVPYVNSVSDRSIRGSNHEPHDDPHERSLRDENLTPHLPWVKTHG
jgi:hypothetical protein